MLYPQKITAKKGKKITKIFLGITIFSAILFPTLNWLCTPKGPKWSVLVLLGILYIWITVGYSLKKGVNIAGQVLFQMVTISALSIGMDVSIGYKGWSLNYVLPISMITANIIMLLLTIINRRKYLRYTIYQISIIAISLLPLVFLTENLIKNKTLSIVSLGISCVNFLVVFILCRKELKEEIQRRLHM